MFLCTEVNACFDNVNLDLSGMFVFCQHKNLPQVVNITMGNENC